MRVRIPTLTVNEKERKAINYHMTGEVGDPATRHDIRDVSQELWQSFIDNLESEYEKAEAEAKAQAKANGKSKSESADATPSQDTVTKLMAAFLKENPDAREALAKELQEA